LFLVALPFKLWFGTRIIYDVHDLWPEMFEAKFGKRGLFYWLVRAASRLTYATADIVIATNESVRAVALARGGKQPDAVFVVRTAPKITTAGVAPDSGLRKGRRHLVGYVGVMGDADGVNYLIDSADHLVHCLGRRDIQFLLMGTGPEHQALLEQRNRLGLQEFIDLPGRVSNEFLFTALKTIDLGVACDPINAYNDHCTMNKTLEYMAFGRAQVMFATKEGRASAGAAAGYVEENSAAHLAQKIAELLDDDVARARMGAIGTQRIRSELSWERSVEHLLAAYTAALAIQPARTADPLIRTASRGHPPRQ
jgi:glycosyltransferase involved in cell wall biosynthesis